MKDRNNDRINTDRAIDARTASPDGRQLARLGELDDYEVADGEPDIRGWDVKAGTDQKIGTVDDLIVDLGALEVRYVDVELDRKTNGLKEDRHVLMPIGAAQLDDDHDVVRVARMPSAGFAAAPAYAHTPLTADDERRIRDFYGDTGPEGDAAARFFGRRRPAREGGQGGQFITRSKE